MYALHNNISALWELGLLQIVLTFEFNTLYSKIT